MISSDHDREEGEALPDLECCMCGDAGLSDELLRCKVCKFRSQHRYCSNLYPKAKSYRICNWCLSKKEEASRQKVQNSSNSGSSSCKSKDETDDDHIRINKNKRNNVNVNNRNYHDDGGLFSDQRKRIKPQLNGSPTKKQAIRSPEKSLASSGKRIITRSGNMEELSNNKNNVGIITRVTRNRVRRYKLLEEVAC